MAINRRTLVTSSLVISLVLAILFTSLPVAHVAEVELSPTDDTYVTSRYPDTNWDGWDGWYLLTRQYNTYEQRSYLMFDLSGIPTGAVITSAELKLYCYEALYGLIGTPRVDVHYCSDTTWSEDDITWDNAPAFSPTVTDYTEVSALDEWYSWDVTADVQTALSAGKLTVVLTTEETEVRAGFASKEYTDEDYRPKLIVTYKETSSITCSVSLGTVKKGENVTVSGAITPAQVGVTVTLTYTKPDGSTLTRTATTDSTGAYSDTYTPDATGSWSVKASLAGDADYTSAESSSVSFTVQKLPLWERSYFGLPLPFLALIVVVIIILIVLLAFMVGRGGR